MPIIIVSRAAIPTRPAPITGTIFLGMLVPNSASIRKPTKGNAGISQSIESMNYVVFVFLISQYIKCITVSSAVHLVHL